MVTERGGLQWQALMPNEVLDRLTKVEVEFYEPEPQYGPVAAMGYLFGFTSYGPAYRFVQDHTERQLPPRTRTDGQWWTLVQMEPLGPTRDLVEVWDRVAKLS